ncbi:EamA domain-containing membrane protein RarD [Roseovarius nanhaiticus]|uniref:EamA domain-containing membrane protein RarD n=2 Tax=Roseovarius nanhaiticus TaxID=573024 RepID=A0A1N7EYM7_9RHOB|nr:EamA domain-containing membrane protein RarD [Roseovarius nanhaiticus]SIR93167.1 EamA domain-containing membrane protein RarD [Roseovarius nanhaiticus]
MRPLLRLAGSALYFGAIPINKSLMSEHLKGLIITALGVLMIVPDSLFVRLIMADPATITFWRAAVAGTLILAGCFVVQGLSGFRAVARTGRPGLLYTLLMATTAPGFVMAISLTSVANVVFIFASIPIFAAIFSRIFLGEPFSRRTVLTMAAVLPGLAIIAYGSHESEIASWQGDLIALAVSASFAAALTTARKMRATSMIPAIPVSYLLSALIMLIWATPGQAMPSQWPLVLGHGTFIALSTCLLTLGPRYLSSAEVSLLILLESVLAPLLVWAVIGEDPGVWALFGGALVIGALVVSNMVALRRRRVRTSPRPPEVSAPR